MSGWDTPTGSWDVHEEPEVPNGPGEQGYQQDQSTAGHRAPRGSEGPPRAGRRGLPGYDQADAYDQAAGYDSGSGYGSAGYGAGPGYGQQPGYEPATGSGLQPSFGSGPPAPGTPANTPSSGPRRAITPGPQRPQAALGAGPSAAVGYDESRTGPFPEYGSAEGNPPSWSDTSDQQGYLSPQTYTAQQSYSAQQSYTAQQGFGSQPGYGADRDYGADQDYLTQVYPPPGFERPGHPESGSSQSDYPESGFPQSDYPESGLAWDSYGQQASGPSGFLPGGTGAAEQSYPASDYQAEAYKLPDSEPSAVGPNGFGQNGQADYGQDGFGPNGFGQAGYGQSGFGPNGASHDVGQDVPAQDSFGQAPGSGGYPLDSYSQGAYTQDGYAPAGYDRDGYGQAGYPQEAYGQGGYGQDSYAPPGFEPPGGQAYGDDDFASRGRPPRSGLSGPERRGPDQGSAHRPGNTRMILYLAASVISVILIVMLVLHLTKSGGSSPPAGSSTPTASTTATAGGAGSRYVLAQAAEVGTYPLNTAATKEFSTIAVTKAVPSAAQIRAKGVGQPGTSVVGIYTIGPVTSVSSSDFRGILFVGFNGTFDPAAVIKVAQSELVSSSVVSAGPHGGDMVCGYNTSAGSDASQCVWVTPTTLGEVQYLQAAYPVKYPGIAALSLQVRNAVEVHAG